MKVKNITGRILAGILAAVLMFTSVPQTAYAIGNIMEVEQGMTEEESDSDDGTAAVAPGQDGGNDENGENTERDNGEENTSAGDVTDENDASDDERLRTEDALESEADEKEEAAEEPEDADVELGVEENGEDISADKEVFDEREVGDAYGEIVTYASSGFAPRKSAPNRNNTSDYTYYYKSNPYVGPNNCTFYAWGRAYELLGYKPHTWTGNACMWWSNNDGYERSNEPRLGAIMCWGVSRDNEYGHVAIVEEIHGDGSVSFSEARYSNCAFDYKTYSTSELSIIYRGTFQGYIYLPGVGTETPPEPPAHVHKEGSEMIGPFTRTISDGDYHIVSALEGDAFNLGTKCLTLGGLPTNKDEINAKAELWAVNGWRDHVFTVTWIDERHGYKIKLKDSRWQSLTVYGDRKYCGTSVTQFPDFGLEDESSIAQQWVIEETSSGYGYNIRARVSGFYMDVPWENTADGTNIQLEERQTNNNQRAQRWFFVPWGEGDSAVQIIQNGEYEIVPKVDNSKAMSATEGLNVEVGARESDGRHVFKVNYLGQGYYRIENKNKGLSLDVANAGSKKGANVQLYKYWETSNEAWIIKSCGDGYFYIVSKCNGLCVDIENGNIGTAIVGTNISMYYYYGGENQKWKFIPYGNSKLDPPTASVPSGTEVEAGTSVSLSCGVDGAEILYTLNGTEPQVGGLYSYSYSEPIIIEHDTTVKAIAVKEGYINSDIAAFVYHVKEDSAPDNPSPEDPGQDNIPNGLWVAGLSQNGYEYTGKAIKPAVRVYDHKTLLTEKKDYTISYTRNTKAYRYASGDQGFDAKKAPTITVTAKGNYSGKETLTFKILPPDIGSNAFAADDMTISYKAKGAQKPVPVLMWKDKKLNNKTDYTVAYYDSSDNKLDCVKEAGVYYVEMTGKGNFGGVRRVKLTVTDQLKLMSKMTVAGIKGQTYTGSAITPAITVKDGKTTLTEGTHYTVSYSRNTSVGTAYAIVTGIEEAGYSGTKRINFKITGTPITKAAVTGLSGQKFIYEGIDITPSIQLSIKTNADEAEKTLMMGTDYTVTLQKNRNAGTATVVFTGKGGYTGTLKKTFKIEKFDIAANTDGRFTAELEQDTVPCAKGGAKPKVTVRFKKSDGSLQTLVEGQDYTLSCRNHTAVNDGSRADKQPTLTVKGKGNFSGTFGTVLTYKIAAQDIGQLTLSAQDRTYQNKKNIYATKVTITDFNGKTLKAGTDYSKNFTYTYKNETAVMNATDYKTMIRAAGDMIDKNDIIPAGTVLMVTATAKDGGNYCGTVTGEYRITQAAISSASISIPKQTYTGREIILDKSQITVKMKENPIDQSQYEIVPGSYKNNVKKGTASVTIRGIDNYGGTKIAKFSIGAKGFLWWWK